MEVIVAGTEPIQADVVFVHGLRGDRIKTWQKEDVFWPRDFLPQELPDVRVMSYGYDGISWVLPLDAVTKSLMAAYLANVMNFFSNASQSSIFQHAINLLEDLQGKRRAPDEVSNWSLHIHPCVH